MWDQCITQGSQLLETIVTGMAFGGIGLASIRTVHFLKSAASWRTFSVSVASPSEAD
jgi:hypothetical protein